MTREAFRIKLAKRLDDFVGGPAVRLARLFLRRPGRCRRPLSKALWIKFWGIGSIVLAEPAVRRLKQLHPGVQVHFLTLERNRELFSLIPSVDRVHSVSFDGLAGFARGALKTVRRLRAERFDAVFDAEFFVNCSALLAWAVRPRCIVGFSRPDGVKRLLQDVSTPFLEGVHTVRQFLNLVDPGNVAEARGLLAWSAARAPGEKNFSDVSPKLSLTHVRPDPPLAFPPRLRTPYVVVNVNASSLALERRWSGEGFAVLGKALLEKFEVDLVLIGSTSERSYVESVAQMIQVGSRVRNLAGALDLVQLARLLRGALMVVSNDSGPIHLASAFDVPTVGFYGPETPIRYGPLSSRRLVFYENLPCSPCMSVENAKTVRCVNNLACMKGIGSGRVVGETVRFLQSLLDARRAAIGAGQRGVG